jgi:hypothetical protein
MGHKKDELNASFSIRNSAYFKPTGCFMFPTLDRGSKMFGGREGCESQMILKFIPSISNIAGFFGNGVIAKLDPTDSKVMIIGSASCYVLWGSKSERPIFSGATATRKRNQATTYNLENDDSDGIISRTSNRFVADFKASTRHDRAPRLDNGELILRRREVHSGRAMTVSSGEKLLVSHQFFYESVTDLCPSYS